mmetsp:Transcript_1385/g.2989  ORF Transcript_1385/g.2989 Transcript_1385/m.2989 type:complete len:232 (-) Transcript_1385:662-1357(-)
MPPDGSPVTASSSRHCHQAPEGSIMPNNVYSSAYAVAEESMWIQTGLFDVLDVANNIAYSGRGEGSREDGGANSPAFPLLDRVRRGGDGAEEGGTKFPSSPPAGFPRRLALIPALRGGRRGGGRSSVPLRLPGARAPRCRPGGPVTPSNEDGLPAANRRARRVEIRKWVRGANAGGAARRRKAKNWPPRVELHRLRNPRRPGCPRRNKSHAPRTGRERGKAAARLQVQASY